MKLPILIALTFVLVQYADCRNTWLPDFGFVTNKTSQLKNYVKEKVHYWFYNNTDNIQPKTTLDDRGRTFKTDTETKQQTIIRERFKKYLTEAQVLDGEIFDSIAPTDMKFNCSEDDPAIYMTTTELIALHGYIAESHTVTTDDGYILTLHRIPHTKINGSNDVKISRKTVLIHHGLLGSSADWIIPGPKKGLPYILSDAGYDVWMANVRGNVYSRAHISYTADSSAFWNFTFHEVSQHDLPAIIDYITAIKGHNAKINYIGHSMGTSVLFALLSTKTHYNKVLRAGFALAPVAYMSNVQSPIKLLAKFADNIEYLLKLLGQNEFLPRNAVMRWLSKHACDIDHYGQAICENSLFLLCGHDEKRFNKTLLPTILGHFPTGASTKTLVHYAQEIRNDGQFQMFDYGQEGNLREYGTPTPPQYPLHNITLPIALLGSYNDWLASNIDVTKLYQQLPNPIEHYVVPLKEFDHIDFLWATDAPKLVYKKLLQLLNKKVNTPV